MSNLLYTVQNLIDEVRSLIDEQNQDSVDDTADLLPALNRAQDYAFDVYSRKYVEPILAKEVLVLESGVQEYDIPENVFEDRIVKMEITVPSSTIGASRATQREVQYISFRDISNYESTSVTNVPYYYTIVGRKIRFAPMPSGTYNARMWYLQNPEKLVLPQGRITIVNQNSNYVIVDQVGSLISTASDSLGNYVNIVDGQSGLIRCSLQIQSIDGGKISFRTTPLRSSVLNRTIASGLTDSTVALEQDDYISPIDGTCVPYYGRPTSNFLIQFTVAEITRKLGGDAAMQEQVVDKFEKQVERTWVGREIRSRVQKRNQIWGVPTRRWYFE